MTNNNSRNDSVFTCGVEGDPTIILLHNARLITSGSGVAENRRIFNYVVMKKLRGTISSIHIPVGKNITEVEAELHQKLQNLFDGTLISSKDPGTRKTLLEYNGLPVLRYSATNTDILLSKELGSWEIKHLSSSKSLSIEVSVPYVASDYEIKARGAGIKAVFKKASRSYSIRNQDGTLNEEWESSLGAECQKGQTARLHLYCEYLRDKYGGHSYLEFGKFEGNKNPTAILHYPVGGGEYLVQDLENPQAPFYEWQRDNFKVYFISDVVNIGYAQTIILGHVNLLHRRHEGLSLIQEALESPEWEDVIMLDMQGKPTNSIEECIVEDDWGYGLRLCEKVEGLLGTFPIMIECATRREASATYQAPTLEQLALTWASSPKIGEALIRDADENLQAVKGFAAMVTNDPDIKLSEDEFYEFYAEE